MNNIDKTIKLSNGVEIPRVGLGVWRIDNSMVSEVISWALDAGYRHVDTAKAYGNEEGVGKAINGSSLKREEIFVTTKLAATNDFFRAEKAFYESLHRLNMEYIDLYILHWPFLNWKNAWKTLEKIYKDGKVRAIGVSNFGIKQLEEFKKLGGMKPMINQVELSPFLNRKKLIEYCKSEGIVVEAYSPLTRGRRINDETISEIAKKYNKSNAQIMIRWGLQQDLIMLPKSTNKSHVESNIQVFDFEISEEDMEKIDSLNENYSALIPGWSRKD